MFVIEILFSCSYCVVLRPCEFYSGALYNGHVEIHNVLALHFMNCRLQWPSLLTYSRRLRFVDAPQPHSFCLPFFDANVCQIQCSLNFSKEYVGDGCLNISPHFPVSHHLDLI